jgi:predicted PurR-regulated permease PerM
MDTAVFQKTRETQLASAMSQYENAHNAYQQLLRSAAAEQDPTTRSTMIQQLQQQNQRLSTVVSGILTAIQQGQQESQQIGPLGSTEQKLQQQLETYRKEMDDLNNARNDIQKLRNLLQETQQSATRAEQYYFGYLIAILILLVVILVMFLFGGGKAAEDMGSALPQQPLFQVPATVNIASITPTGAPPV